MEQTSSEIAELIERAGRGDAAAWQALSTAHRARLRRMIAARLDRRMRSRVDPSDVVQEAMVMAARALPEYVKERPIPFFAWLEQFARERLMKLHRFHIRVQRRSVLREMRLSRASPHASPTPVVHQLAASGTSPSQNLVRDEARQKISDALARLSAADRDLVVMRNFDRLTTADVAAALGITVGAVKVRHLRALRRLQSIMEKQ